MKNILSMNFFNRQKKVVAEPVRPSTAAVRPADTFKGLSVLVVDDSRTQLHAMEKILTAAGINTITAENGKQGILMARHKHPDIILMDIVMPEINGFQATRYLSRHPDTAHIPIIIISGSNQESDKAWGFKLGAREFMHKPVNRDELFAKIDMLMDERKQAERVQHVG
ncbi:MAG: twitching motility two-component system response regulator PilH [Pseudomonadota bacterium]|nr:twitching motility two-component system response regulator PilH [Pseudomonadota bacterium]